MRLLSSLRQRKKSRIDTMNHINISQSAIHHNFSLLQSLKPNAEIFPVVKSNAYGHGLYEMTQILKTLPVKMVCVDSYPEYQWVEKRTPFQILVIGETLPQNYKHYNRKRTSFAVYNMETIKAFWQLSWTTRVHLFLNTWMNREGMQEDELYDILKLCKQFPHLAIEWVMSHFAVADEIRDDETNAQVETFKKMYSEIETFGYRPQRRHVANSAWIAKIHDPFFTASRAGLSLYGYSLLSEADAHAKKLGWLTPALQVMSKVISLQDLHAWDIVSYSGTYQATDEERICTLPFWYQEWLPRLVSNHRQVQWNNQRLPQVGNVCMNLSTYRTLGHDVQVGDDIEVIWSDPNAPNAVYTLAKLANTLPYEVLIHLDRGMRRRIV